MLTWSDRHYFSKCLSHNCNRSKKRWRKFFCQTKYWRSIHTKFVENKKTILYRITNWKTSLGVVPKIGIQWWQRRCRFDSLFMRNQYKARSLRISYELYVTGQFAYLCIFSFLCIENVFSEKCCPQCIRVMRLCFYY